VAMTRRAATGNARQEADQLIRDRTGSTRFVGMSDGEGAAVGLPGPADPVTFYLDRVVPTSDTGKQAAVQSLVEGDSGKAAGTFVPVGQLARKKAARTVRAVRVPVPDGLCWVLTTCAEPRGTGGMWLPDELFRELYAPYDPEARVLLRA
jgi:hypothetical protein